MPEDIRDKLSIRHEDVSALNFIKASSPYFFRKHFRQGLRSHVMEILKRSDIQIENNGVVIDGARWYPRAKPTHMLRLFRTRLATVDRALEEIKRVKVVEHYLGPDFIAESSEFLVDYHGPEGPCIMLCGVQAYVEGQILDPWSLLDADRLLPSLYAAFHAAEAHSESFRSRWLRETRQKGAAFVRKIKQMIAEVKHIPDLAGAGNLVVTKTGEIRLVDINNISSVTLDAEIRLDDKGYPVCDKSIEALWLIETKFLGRPTRRKETIYRTFLDPHRKRQVKIKEELFYRNRA